MTEKTDLTENSRTAGPGNDNPKASVLADLQGWPLALTLLCAALALTLGLYFESAASAVDLWWNRSAYNHGFLIIPISLYLVWDKRDVLAAMTPRPDILGLIVIGGFSAAWVIARSAGINEGEHFALVGVIQGVVLAVLGRQLFLAMILPMAYLWLMVPTGTVIIPVLQGAAHWLSATMLTLSGVPVFTQGFLIEVPTGLYDVAPGCSGLNFILASLALAPLYGYMMYDGIGKRLTAIAVMLGVAVFANGVRIYGIIALAEFSDQRIDIVDDHLLYGWGFFAAVLVLVGYTGLRFADPVQTEEQTETRPAVAHIARRKIFAGAVVAMVVLAALPLYRLAALTASSQVTVGDFDVSSLDLEAVGEASGRWQPDYPYATQTRLFGATRRNVEADIYLAGYSTPRAASEMITSGNSIAGSLSYRTAGSFSRRIESRDASIKWHFVKLWSRDGARLVARARLVEGAYVASSLKAKLLQARATLLWSFQGSGVILVSIPVSGFTPEDFEAASDDLVRFLDGVDVQGLFIGTRSQSDKR